MFGAASCAAVLEYAANGWEIDIAATEPDAGLSRAPAPLPLPLAARMAACVLV